ncbi:MAG TPA: SH3 domain-containing protein [Thermomicrobiales bacterium]|nr:SH3 domain-containing protein [Thermomicrobiales bacterium]
MADNHRPADQGRTTPRYRNVSGRPLNRRVVMKAAAGFGAMVAAGGIGGGGGVQAPRRAAAQEADGTRAREWHAAEHAGIAATSEWTTFQAEFPFWSIGAGWNGDVGEWPIVELQLSTDGTTWGETWQLTARTDDGGRKSRDGRLFTDLVFTEGAQWVRYRVLDSDGNPGEAAGLLFAYIDPTDGPWDKDRADRTMLRQLRESDETDTRVPPSIITREEWGADESLRFDTYGQIWPPEYEEVQHAIVHHSGVNYPNDGFLSIRSVYYYHAVTQGWGDIGYNYLVDGNGRIFEGRFGGQNVIGGHSYEYAIGSSGICVIGDYEYKRATDVAKAALVQIIAWTIRDLDPYARKPFHEAPSLPTICAHRDVNQTNCPGSLLYADLQEIRDSVAAVLDANDLNTPFPGGMVPGDRVQVQTDDGGPLNVRSSAAGSVIGQVANKTYAWVNDGPITRTDGNWYRIEWNGGQGWVSARYLIVVQVAPPPIDADDFPFGLNVRFTAETNMRSKPSTGSSVLRTVKRNTWGAVIAGPQKANGYDWYQVRLQNATPDGWSIKNNMTAAPVNNSPTAKFKVGDTVIASDTTNVRPRPGIAQTVASTAPAGTIMKITVAPVGVTGYIWYGVYSDAFGGGWVAEDYLQRASAPPPTGNKFAIGDGVRVTEALNMRSGPSTSNGVVAVLNPGTTGKVVGGPRAGNGYVWYQIQTSQGTGWAVQDWLAKTSSTPPPSTPTFRAGDAVRVTMSMNFRSGPGVSYGKLGVLRPGMTGTVISGYPRSADGVQWSLIQTSEGRGWVSHEGIEKATAPAAPALRAGDRVRVIEPLNMRSGPGTSYGAIATLSVGTTGTVTSGYSRAANGYQWSLIETSAGRGWVVNVGLQKVSTPPPSSGGKFAIGDNVRVTEALNMRSGPSTSNGVVAVLPAGTTGKVTSGPRSGSGYTWWQIQTSQGTGWVVESWIAKSSTASSPSAVFSTGDMAQVFDGALNMRSGPSTSNGVVAVLPDGHRVTITGGSRTGSGYTWWPVRSATYGSGWVVQTYIRKV